MTRALSLAMPNALLPNRSSYLHAEPWQEEEWIEEENPITLVESLPAPPQQKATGALQMHVEGVLNALCAQGVRIPEKDEVRAYLLKFPDMAEALRPIAKLTRQAFPEAQLVLTVYHDPEIDDHYLTLEIRCRDYSDQFFQRLGELDEKVAVWLNGRKGWILVTTNFHPPE